jgi:hypothetical protein
MSISIKPSENLGILGYEEAKYPVEDCKQFYANMLRENELIAMRREDTPLRPTESNEPANALSRLFFEKLENARYFYHDYKRKVEEIIFYSLPRIPPKSEPKLLSILFKRAELENLVKKYISPNVCYAFNACLSEEERSHFIDQYDADFDREFSEICETTTKCLETLTTNSCDRTQFLPYMPKIEDKNKKPLPHKSALITNFLILFSESKFTSTLIQIDKKLLKEYQKYYTLLCNDIWFVIQKVHPDSRKELLLILFEKSHFLLTFFEKFFSTNIKDNFTKLSSDEQITFLENHVENFDTEFARLPHLIGQTILTIVRKDSAMEKVSEPDVEKWFMSWNRSFENAPSIPKEKALLILYQALLYDDEIASSTISYANEKSCRDRYGVQNRAAITFLEDCKTVEASGNIENQEVHEIWTDRYNQSIQTFEARASEILCDLPSHLHRNLLSILFEKTGTDEKLEELLQVGTEDELNHAFDCWIQEKSTAIDDIANQCNTDYNHLLIIRLTKYGPDRQGLSNFLYSYWQSLKPPIARDLPEESPSTIRQLRETASNIRAYLDLHPNPQERTALLSDVQRELYRLEWRVLQGQLSENNLRGELSTLERRIVPSLFQRNWAWLISFDGNTMDTIALKIFAWATVIFPLIVLTIFPLVDYFDGTAASTA